jgi:hypothetical protein
MKIKIRLLAGVSKTFCLKLPVNRRFPFSFTLIFNRSCQSNGLWAIFQVRGDLFKFGFNTL